MICGSMNWKERIEIAILCLNEFPQNSSEFAQNYKTYARLLKVWNNRYKNK